MNTRTSSALIAVLGAGLCCAPSARAQEASQDPYRKQMESLQRDMSNAKTDPERAAVQEKMRQSQAQRRAARPVKEPTAAEKEASRRRMEERLKNDPALSQMYQLQQSLTNAKTAQERISLLDQMKALRDKRLAEEEARLTPEQKAARAASGQKAAQLRAQLEPFMRSLREAKTDAQRDALRARMRDVAKQYR